MCILATYFYILKKKHLHLLFVNKNRLHRNYTKVLIFYIKYCWLCFQQQILYQIWVISTFLCIGKPINSNSQAISSRKFIFMIMAIHFLYLWLISISYIKVNFFSFYCLKINCRSQYNTYKCQEYMDTFWQDPVYRNSLLKYYMFYLCFLFSCLSLSDSHLNRYVNIILGCNLVILPNWKNIDSCINMFAYLWSRQVWLNTN